jgi:hypothetical protein
MYFRLGRMVVQLIWINDMAYNGTVSGIGVYPSGRQTEVFRTINGASTYTDPFQGLLNLNQAMRRSPVSFKPFECASQEACESPDYYTVGDAPGAGDIKNSLVTTVKGDLSQGWFGGGLSFAARSSGPVLTLDTPPAGAFNDFADDPRGGKWGCCMGVQDDPSSSCADLLAERDGAGNPTCR